MGITFGGGEDTKAKRTSTLPLILGRVLSARVGFQTAGSISMVGLPDLSPPQEPALPSLALRVTLPSSLG